MIKKILIFLSCIVIVLGGLALIWKSDVREKNTLRIAFSGDIQSLHGSTTQDANTHRVTYMLFEGLMRRDDKDMPQLAAASCYDLSDDQKTYTFYLRDSQWSDGTPLTARDFEYAWKRLIDPNSEATLRISHFFDCIKNAKECLCGGKDIDSVGIKAVNDKTLVVELEYPCPFLIDLLTVSYFFPLPEHIIKKEGHWMTSSTLVYNGPFKLQKWRHNSEIVLKKNTNYWDKSHVYLDGIHISIIPNTTTVLNMFQRNELDWVGSPFCLMSYDISCDTLTQDTEDASILWCLCNTKKPCLNNKKFRQALSYAIDRKTIVENAFSTKDRSAKSIFPSTLELSDLSYFDNKDAFFAKQLFSEALEELNISREDLPEMYLSYVADSEVQHRIAQAIQDQWRAHLGFNCSLQRVEWGAHYGNLTRGSYDLGFVSWSALCMDPYYSMEFFRSKSENLCMWENQDFIHYLDQAKLEFNDGRRIDKLLKAESILMDEMPVIPLCSLNKRFNKNPKLKGEVVSQFRLVDFKSAYFGDN
jgi:oligopeptide transport system substrate-binding protein